MNNNYKSPIKIVTAFENWKLGATAPKPFLHIQPNYHIRLYIISQHNFTESFNERLQIPCVKRYFLRYKMLRIGWDGLCEKN